MPLTITQFPARDAGTGEHTQADATTYEADDVTNVAETAADLPAEVTYTADDVQNKPDEGGVDAEPVTTNADWPTKAAPKTAEAKVVTEADTKTEKAPAKRAARKRS